MKPQTHLLVLSSVTLLCSGFFYVVHALNATMRVRAYKTQVGIENLMSKVQTARLQLKEQQDKWNLGPAAANKVGPAILSDLAALAEKNNNPNLKALLQKHGVRTAPAKEGN